MSSDKDAPALVQFGAGSDQSKRDVNLSVRGTVGPDYLGQETTTVDGHPNDRPGVRSRLPEETGGDDPRIRRMDTGEDLPVLLESAMRADPIEGVQGTFSTIVEGTCARCGYDRLIRSVHTLAGEHEERCNACEAIQDPRADGGYRMPTTAAERAERDRQSGRHLTDLLAGVAVDMEPDTGCGPYISLIRSERRTRLAKTDVADVFFALVEQGDIDLGDEVNRRVHGIERTNLAATILPEDLGLRCKGGDDGDG